ncbi:Eaf5 protein [Maudiozyma humilis]|uniref:Eaf5 protein n=1 Tax=Maudiozyma humilis TaxID=51915 RepID=A0AAV5S2K5_MAUHU|nr:Eaf5 protein [Kazachstania humilis]
MDPLVKELIVLQIIYAQLLPKVSQDASSEGNSPGAPLPGTSATASSDSSLISSNIKLSLVKLTNGVQNNVLVSAITAARSHSATDAEEMTTTATPAAKLNIGDILGTVKELFPLQRLVLADGQLSFHNLKVADIRALIAEKYSGYRARQVQAIQQLDSQISMALASISAQENADRHKNKKQRVSAASSPGDTNTNNNTAVPRSRTTTPEGSMAMRNADPKREKLLQLYRDTVLNKLQAKTKVLDKLYAQLERGPGETSTDRRIVRELLNLEKIKTTTPISVNNLQLILQKSASDGIMAAATGSPTWRIAKQLQSELDDTVQFMRRALE